MKRNTLQSWFRIIGILLLAFLLWKIDFRRVLSVLAQADPLLVTIAVILNLPQISLKAIRWQRLLKSQKISYPVSSAILSYFGSIFIGLLTPGRLGEFIKMWHVHHDCGVPKMRAFSSVLADRLFDLYALLIFGGAALLSKTVAQKAGWIGFAASAAILVLPLVVYLSDPLFAQIKAAGQHLGRFGQKLFAEDSWILRLRQGLKELSGAAIVTSIAFTIVAYALFFLQCYLLALALNINAGFLQISFAVALGSLITLLPISISGLGTREASIIAYLGSVGVPSDAALGYSLLVFVTFYLAGAIFGLIAWWIKPVSWKTVREMEQEKGE